MSDEKERDMCKVAPRLLIGLDDSASINFPANLGKFFETFSYFSLIFDIYIVCVVAYNVLCFRLFFLIVCHQVIIWRNAVGTWQNDLQSARCLIGASPLPRSSVPPTTLYIDPSLCQPAPAADWTRQTHSPTSTIIKVIIPLTVERKWPVPSSSWAHQAWLSSPW